MAQGLYGQGKSGGKCPFYLGQGQSGKLTMVKGEWHFCSIGQGENVMFYFHRSICFIFLTFKIYPCNKCYLLLCNLINPRKI